MRAKKGKEDGTLIQVSASPYPIRNGWVQEDPWTFHFLARTLPGSGANDKVGWRQISLTTRQANSIEKFNSVMGDHGISLDTEMSKEFRSFIVAWQTQLQKTKEGVISAAPYGWAQGGGVMEGFAYGGRIWSPTGDRPAGSADLEIARQYKPQGELEVWKRAAAMVTDLDSPSRNAMLATAFAGPLVQFTGLEG
ncbi:MAG TPA: DUF927 domain-containing protein, partial [Rubrobacter sp.]|nr:DUF927 domain-containing protein [Rubrobacter sp.]